MAGNLPLLESDLLIRTAIGCIDRSVQATCRTRIGVLRTGTPTGRNGMSQKAPISSHGAANGQSQSADDGTAASSVRF